MISLNAKLLLVRQPVQRGMQLRWSKEKEKEKKRKKSEEECCNKVEGSHPTAFTVNYGCTRQA